ncbi:polyamine deacetylase HDAC10 isoform X1 [Podarcis raffonei]|uniref:polyamine deacetylase HDAC10 isoform X1 n=1 Tax=Podarcis raffonei TaxID=65483 RepID=UPI0023297460|nr:polyamine deacetylase HDAC10 isoform X1 [Podarcis raffonei]XP_053262893.1 polyamine deacetylase HDAC10 isoform X1 [Podarcis raffonei]XP_053262894.1 polyamine deacetylase HDAC10 isoform X1 [Podarcis raffonei]XP_053262895.1 polyamine deacetylase HDAC10 isoform X1 [Podarcis raffonei]
MASGTALVYDDEMTSHKLLWDDPVCDIEVPERLSSCYERLKCYNLVERCVSVPVREGTEEEVMLVHSSDYLETVKRTPKMTEEELRKTSAGYDAVFFHPTTYRCAKLAVGGTLDMVDAVMSGKTRNGMALIRPPGHHSQRNAANGFCIFNNVAIAAKYAQRKYGLRRVLVVDWDVHHGQGIQYIFNEDPSVLYFSWHRYEHQQYWPTLRESDYDAVGQGKGKGFNINVPWNKIGMGNADYVAVFLHVLLPLAFEFDPELVLVSAGYDSGIGDPEGQMSATPECFAHLTHFLMQLAKGKLCVVLEGGYHLRSLSESVCMTLKTLLGDPLPRLSGEMAPCLSALESIHNVRAVHKPYWKCLMHEDVAPLQDLSTRAQLLHPLEAGRPNSEETIRTDKFLELHMKNISFPRPHVKTTVAVDESNARLLSPSVQIEKGKDTKELKALFSGLDADLVKEGKDLNSFLNMLAVLDKIIKKEVTNGLAVSSEVSLSSAIALKHCRNLKVKKVLCVSVGDVDVKTDLDDGKVLLINISAKPPKKSDTKYNITVNWEKGVETNNFFSPALGLILPVAYSYQPDLTIIILGPNQNVGQNGISLLIRLLQGLAQSHILALIQDTEVTLLQDIIKPLTSDFTPSFGTYAPDLKENVQRVIELREQLQNEWKLLQCSGK